MLEISTYKSVLKRFSFLLIVLIYASSSVLLTSIAYAAESEPITFGNVVIGETRLKLRVKDFKIRLKLNQNIKSRIVLKKGSIQWIRINEVLLTPRARIAIYFKDNATNYSLKYRGHSILMQQNKKGIAHTEFFVSLFNSDKINIYKNGKKIGDIDLYAKKMNKKRQTTLVDYSCSRNAVSVKGLEGEFISLGCKMNRIGKFGKEKPMLELIWSSANYRLLDNSESPYLAVFLSNNPVKLKVINHNNEIKEIELIARVPKRLHRLNIAYGFGPYAFETTFDQADDPDVDDILKYTTPAAPAFMAYFNYKIDADTSIRGFDAIVAKDSIFNNLGVYFASDIAKPMDKKLTITTLIGMQHLYYKFDSDFEARSEPIFPQGIEINYKHAFGIENYLIGGGAFLSADDAVDYQNIWVRWGKSIFWELNYIYWGTEGHSAKMWGLSAGFFFGGFL